MQTYCRRCGNPFYVGPCQGYGDNVRYEGVNDPCPRCAAQIRRLHEAAEAPRESYPLPPVQQEPTT